MNERSTWTVPSGLPLAPKLLREISFPWRGEATLLEGRWSCLLSGRSQSCGSQSGNLFASRKISFYGHQNRSIFCARDLLNSTNRLEFKGYNDK